MEPIVADPELVACNCQKTAKILQYIFKQFNQFTLRVCPK